MNRRPYIGINGLGLADIVPTATEIQRNNPINHDVAYGVQVSTTTQLLDKPNKYGENWYPVGRNLTEWMYKLHCESFNNGIVHINSDTTEPLALLAFIKYILRKTAVLSFDESELGSTYCKSQYLVDGIQLNNLPWGSVDYSGVLESTFSMQNGPKINRLILQANSQLIDANSPRQLAEHALRLGPFVSHVLLDTSGGRGIPLDAERLIPYIEELGSKEVAVGVAGGLSPTNVNVLATPLLTRFPKLSIDAETGLRDGYCKSCPIKSDFSTLKATTFVKEINDILNL